MGGGCGASSPAAAAAENRAPAAGVAQSAPEPAAVAKCPFFRAPYLSRAESEPTKVNLKVLHPTKYLNNYARQSIPRRKKKQSNGSRISS